MDPVPLFDEDYRLSPEPSSELSSSIATTTTVDETFLHATDLEVTPSDLAHTDIQGIPWARLDRTREEYRLNRIRDYRDYEMMRNPIIYKGNDLQEIVEIPKANSDYFVFKFMSKLVNCSVHHFQLRHLVWAPSRQAVYFPHIHKIRKWNPTNNAAQSEFNCTNPCWQFSKISTICATERMLVVGGFYGELLIRSAFNSKPTVLEIGDEENNIVNHILPLYHQDEFLVSANDGIVRQIDFNTGRIIENFRLPWPVNCSCSSPDGRLICSVGDGHETILTDRISGDRALSFAHHVDFSFSCAWAPSGYLLATGNQDHSCCIYDLRKTSTPLSILGGHIAAIRSLKFSPDSRFLAVGEADDFVHLFDVSCGLIGEQRQTIDFFGEVAGLDFSPDGELLYIGCSGIENGGIIEFERWHYDNANRFDHILL